MATVKPAYATEIREIQERMALIRHEMHQDVQGAVHGAHQLTDWRCLVGKYPWVSLGVATAIGYLVVPRRASRRQSHADGSTAARSAAAPSAAERPAPTGGSGAKPLSAVTRLLLPVVVRAAQNYALHLFEQWLAAHPLHPKTTAPDGSAEESEVIGREVLNISDRPPRDHPSRPITKGG